MDTYVKDLAPWEKKNKYYRDISLGKDTASQINAISNQTREMIASQISSKNELIASKKIANSVIDNFVYKTENVANGILGLKAAFEWGISDVVWQIELKNQELKNVLNVIYAPHGIRMKDFRRQAEEAYDNGEMDDALDIFMQLLREVREDFTVHISLGIIYLFYKLEKERALDHFNEAVDTAKLPSTYHASYALLYKGLIKRDFGLVDEAEKCTKEAMILMPKLTEAFYQNAQYNALLNKPDNAIPLLKKIINSDLTYCLKINNEPDFDRIKSQITSMFKEIRNEKSNIVKDKHEELNKRILSLNDTIKSMMNFGYDVSKDINIKSLQEQNDEITEKLENNSIFDAYIVRFDFPQLEKRLQVNSLELRKSCQEISKKINDKIQEVGEKLLGTKKKKMSDVLGFLLYLFIGQIIVIPIGLTLNTSTGIFIAEAALVIICIYWHLILPRSKWKRVYELQEKKEKLDRIAGKI